jgi:hypothetical protein
MKTMLVAATFLLLIAGPARADELTWSEDYEKALKAAEAEAKPILYFHHMPR